MKLKNMKIGTQLLLGYAAMLLFVIVLGVVSWQQTEKIHLQTENMYNHPLKVRRAIGHLKADVYAIRVELKDMFLVSGIDEIAGNLKEMEALKTSAFQQIDTINAQYLGPRSDVDSLRMAFVTWNAVRDEIVRMVYAGQKQEAITETRSGGTGYDQAKRVLLALAKIDVFAIDNGDELYRTSKKVSHQLNMQLLFLVIAIVSFTLLISYFLLKHIRGPLSELTDAAHRFRKGEREVRSTYSLTNEFGDLAASFNSLAEDVQMRMKLSENSARLANILMSEDDTKKFFHVMLREFSKDTGAQLAAVYLLSEDRRQYELYESIGLSGSAKLSYAADNFEGEFGMSLATKKLQHLRNIPSDTSFIFSTAAGEFIPREIVSIPILAGVQTVALVSFATVNSFDVNSLLLIENMLDTLSARIASVLAYRKVYEYSRQMEVQNRELEVQKVELSSQSVELMIQNNELDIQKKQLDESNRLKTNFLSNMSHELRTPLNSVIALSGVLGRRLARQIPEEEYSYLEVIERNGKQLLSLINDILDISRIESGREEFEVSRFNPDVLIAEVVALITPLAIQKKIKLQHITGDSELSITTDSDKCRHILQNLIGNAVKFTEIGHVDVSARVVNRMLEIEVSDTGIGIDEQNIPHIFDEFRQADGGTSRRFGGTGLGLAIAKKYADLLGGTIIVSSSPGNGSRFILKLPLKFDAGIKTSYPLTTMERPVAVPLTNRQAMDTSAPKTILLVEDSEPAIIQIRDIFGEESYHIAVARDGREALAMVDNMIPDAIILDLMMPEIDGFEVLKKLRELPATALVPVLILTAKHITKEELSFLKRNNVHQLIQKGDINREKLKAAVAAMVIPLPKTLNDL